MHATVEAPQVFPGASSLEELAAPEHQPKFYKLKKRQPDEPHGLSNIPKNAGNKSHIG